MMLPLPEVVPFLVDGDMVSGVAPPNETDRNCMSHLLHRVPHSEKWVCPESGDDGDDVDLSNKDGCVQIIADYDNFTWHRMNQGDFVFMEQDTEYDIPALRDDKVTQDLTLDWVEEGTLPEPKDKMKDAPGCLLKGREQIFRSPVVSFMSTLPLIFWKVSFGEINRLAHQEMRKARAIVLNEHNLCGTKWKQDITLGEFMVFFGILLQMYSFPLSVYSYMLY
jgi:hypothetical protein